jgi:3-hydroxyisobutyrate dehydrogenase-like beta-hydroxyacid dehydrogenase
VSGLVGVVGTGQIGGGVAASLIRAGRRVVVRDRLPEATAPLAGAATVAASAAEVAEACGVVLIVVVDADQVREVLAGPDGLLSARRPAPLVSVLSTISVGDLRACSELAEPRGVALLDCGVTGGRVAAREGRLVSLVGGPREAVEELRPVLDCFSLRVLHVGPLGAVLQTKIARNLLTYGTLLAAFETRRLAAAAGVDLDLLAEAIRISDEQIGGSARHLLRVAGGPLDAAREPELYSQAIASEHLMHKDLGAALGLAEELGLELPLAAFARSRSNEVFGIT